MNTAKQIFDLIFTPIREINKLVLSILSALKMPILVGTIAPFLLGLISLVVLAVVPISPLIVIYAIYDRKKKHIEVMNGLIEQDKLKTSPFKNILDNFNKFKTDASKEE
jgi:hypothetical protein